MRAALMIYSRFMTPLFAYQRSPSPATAAAAAAAVAAAATAATAHGCSVCKDATAAAANCSSPFEYFDAAVGAPQIKLSDFAMGRFLAQDVRLTPENPRDRERSLRESQRLPYKAPELLLLREQQQQQYQQYGYEVDVWSAAVVFFELVTCEPPFCCSSELVHFIECCRLVGTPVTKQQWMHILGPLQQQQQQQQPMILQGDEEREILEEKAAAAVYPMMWLEMLPLWPAPRWQQMLHQLQHEEQQLLQQWGASISNYGTPGEKQQLQQLQQLLRLVQEAQLKVVEKRHCSSSSTSPSHPAPASPLPAAAPTAATAATTASATGLREEEATESEKTLLNFGRLIGSGPLLLLQQTLTIDRTQRLPAVRKLMLFLLLLWEFIAAAANVEQTVLWSCCSTA
ncbi:protein kinase (incomplete catalytic triad), putative [Eimeria maxima]|uniref:Protein kinase (Incomplete catalytic triad), putative n=1 Tax=Eimeria maxima TaxID=5804 RepID=U6LZU8_EIMMA|nr:protein kinase (incomplete catalytic triad), putative [Eimeria maxima]CDJ57276.1 protein kinase (incomplete catalytic triad), putative [Eimeria maxima]